MEDFDTYKTPKKERIIPAPLWREKKIATAHAFPSEVGLSSVISFPRQPLKTRTFESKLKVSEELPHLMEGSCQQLLDDLAKIRKTMKVTFGEFNTLEDCVLPNNEQLTEYASSNCLPRLNNVNTSVRNQDEPSMELYHLVV